MNWKIWEAFMRKRRKPTPPPATIDELTQPPAVEEPVPEPVPEPSVEPEPAPVPPDVFMLWCPDCGGVGRHVVDADAKPCEGKLMRVKYVPVKANPLRGEESDADDLRD